MQSVWVARHGETEWNTQSRFQGQLDSPLTERGWQQVRASAGRLVGEPIDRVFSSPAGRARASAGVFADALGRPVEIVDDLAELDHGSFAGWTGAEFERDAPREWAARAQDKYVYRFPGGESYADIDARAGRALGAVAESGARQPLLVCHGMIGRMLLRNLLGWSVGEAFAIELRNDAVYRAELPGHRLVEIG